MLTARNGVPALPVTRLGYTPYGPTSADRGCILRLAPERRFAIGFASPELQHNGAELRPR